MQTNFTYYAFISYSHEDERWAKWLQNQIESYRIPSVIRKEVTRLPKKVRPIFRDMTDLGAGGLLESIHAELEDSRYLIVICSPHSARSGYVSKEIEHFLSLGREKYIIPFIVDGEPHSKDSNQECFNPSFAKFTDEPLGINAQEIGKRQAKVKVIAKLLELKFDALWQRFRKRERIKKLLLGLGVLFIALMGFGYWWYVHPKYEYYADYVDTWGVPEGIYLLDRETHKHCGSQYRFKYRRIPLSEQNALKWRLSEVALVNAQGTVITSWLDEYPERFVMQELIYSHTDGHLIQVNNYNSIGSLLLRLRFSSKDAIPATIVDFQGANDFDASGYLSAHATSQRYQIAGGVEDNKSNINRIAITRDSNGHIVQKTYHGNNNVDLDESKMSDADGIYGMSYQLDSLGRVIEEQFLGKDYQPYAIKNGLSKRKYEYNELGRLCKSINLDKNEDLILDETHAAMIHFKTDKYGNCIEKSYYGIDGQLAVNDYECSKFAMNYDRFGNVIELKLLGQNGEAVSDGDMHKFVIKYDKKGRYIEFAYYDSLNNLCISPEGCAILTRKYDKHGNMIQIAAYDTGRRLCLLEDDGWAIMDREYNKNNQCISRQYLDTDKKPCMCNDGYARFDSKYNERGLCKEHLYYDTIGNLCITKEGYARATAQYDERGNQTEYAFYDTEGNLNCTTDSCVRIVMKYDKSGKRTSRIGYDNKGNVVFSHIDN